MLAKIQRSIQKRGVRGFLRTAFMDLIEAFEKHSAKQRDTRTHYKFTNRSLGRKKLIIILAGYKDYLWPATLDRIHAHAPDDYDVCITSSGIQSKDLIDLCEKLGWSYLCTKRNSPGIALNKAILLHPSADYIFKIDEDIFVANGFFESMLDGYEKITAEIAIEPGFCSPILNVNGLSYREFLRTLGIENEYKNRFGKLISRCGNLPIHNNPEAAWWIWENTLPFDFVAGKFANKKSYSFCYTRFSIGAILFRRNFWEQIGGFKSSWHEGVLGADEDALCRDCVSLSRPMCIIHSVLAGHFSFHTQEALMMKKLPVMAEIDPKTFAPEIFSKKQ